MSVRSRMSARTTIGLDLGGTKMLCGVVAGDGEVLRLSRSRSSGLGREELIGAIKATVTAAREAHPEAEAVGLGVPCMLDQRGRVSYSNHLDLAGLALGELIEAESGLPTAIRNDADAAAIAEHRWGAARGGRDVVVLTVGTGIGGALIVEGRPHRGASGAGAELGHMVVDSDGPECGGGCPGRGCLEAFVSGAALAREGRLVAEREPESRLGRELAAAGRLDGAAVTSAALAGDRAAEGLIAAMGRMLGVGLVSLANAFDPEQMVVGGGVLRAGELLLGPAREEFRARVLPPHREIPIVAAALGENAGMIGAATMALDALEDRESGTD